VPRSFAIATKEVTVAEFRRFLAANPEVARHFEGAEQARSLKKYAPEEDGPMIGMSWYQAAAYCNWLSQVEGLPETEWCYPKDVSKAPAVLVLAEGYLRRKGYRLPMEDEWEYACRAGAVTSRYYGRSEALLGDYAWYQGNAEGRAHRVGTLRPNDLGLFDMLGNVSEWCQGHFGTYPQGKQLWKEAEEKAVRAADQRVSRGAGLNDMGASVRCSHRFNSPVTGTFVDLGLRVARTCD
jgi:formylglycine-generating enzyme required for sulfatase activity